LVPGAGSAGDRYNSRPYRQIVTVANILQHEQALQNIANANGGTRVAGSAGNEETIDYIASTMTAAGWAVQTQRFVFPFFQELSPSTFSQTAPTAKSFVNGTDFATMQYSGSGNVTANVTALGKPAKSDGSCSARDLYVRREGGERVWRWCVRGRCLQ
jgi:hypothetical protein